MTITEFRNLDKTEQDEEVQNCGIYLVNYREGDLMCDVYKLYEFFVRFCYNVNTHEHPKIMALTGTDDIHLYEQKVFPFSGN